MQQPGSGMPTNNAATATAAGPSQSDIDKQRVALLLEINSHLLELIQTLQSAGKGGDVQSPAQPNDANPPEQKKPSREYVEPLRRMQANLAYLASLAERHQKPGQAAGQPPPWPQVMTAPPGDEKLGQMYARLQALFPAWRVQQQRLAAAQAAQAQQAAGGGPSGAGMGTQNPMGQGGMGGQQQAMMGGGMPMGMGMHQGGGGGSGGGDQRTMG
jgi:hypothetical protein